MCAQASLTLYDTIHYSALGTSVHLILQVRLLEWVAIPSSRSYFQPRIGIEPASPVSPALASAFFTSATWEAQQTMSANQF